MIKRIDLTRDFAAHKKEYLDAITKVCEETAFSGVQSTNTGVAPV